MTIQKTLGLVLALGVMFGILLGWSVTARAAVNATSGTITTPVLTSASVPSSLTVTLSNNDDWRSTRVEVSIPGPNNDIDTCINTTDFTTNGSHTANFSFNAPGTAGNYTAVFTAYENSNCTGSDDSVSKNFTVNNPPPPPPVDVCPNVNGNQPAGPCADTLCVAPAAWDIGTQSCVAPVLPPPPPPVVVPAPVVNGGGWNGGCTTYAKENMPWWGEVPCTPLGGTNQPPAVTPEYLAAKNAGQTIPSICTPLLGQYLRYGDAGTAVMTLQAFLNGNLGVSYAIDGVFGDPTLKAVNTFQVKYTDEILAPWNITEPTGFVGKTTTAKINALNCTK